MPSLRDNKRMSALPPAVDEQELRTGRASILYDAAQGVKPDPRWFDRAFWAARNALSEVPAGRGQVAFIREAGRRWVLRHYRRGGFIAKFLDDTFAWLGAARTRSWREWRLLATLFAEGFPVPQPIAARYERSGLVYRADLMTVEIPGTGTLAKRIAGNSLESSCWREVGAVIARLHRRGVHHVDLNAHNVLLDAANAVHIIDFDRARLRTRGAWEAAVLARLRRSLDKIKRQDDGVRFGEAEWAELLGGYRQHGS